jgi:hypothetical protein
MSSKIEICIVPTYKKTYEKATKHCISVSDIETYLSIDKQYHERLDVNDKLKLSIDLDHITRTNKNASFDMICNDICTYLNITMKDISYTTNFSSLEGSHHIVIPKYFMNSAEQKLLWTNFKEQYNYGTEIDANIFGKNGWLRLPNQTKEMVKNTEHIIQNGNIEDFVLKYIPDNCTEYKTNIISKSESDKTSVLSKCTITKPDNKSNKSLFTNDTNDYNDEEYKKLDYFINNGFDDANFTHEQMSKISYALNGHFKEKGLILFLNIAKKYSDNYDENEYTNRYNRSIPTKEIGIGTIYFIFNEVDKKLSNKLLKSYKEILVKNNKPKREIEIEIMYIDSDNQCADILFDEFVDKLIYCKGQLFLKINNIWSNDKQTIDLTLLNTILNKPFYMITEKGKETPYSSFVRNAKNIREALISKIMMNNNKNEIYEKFHTTTKGRICFLDGVLDFQTKLFYTWKNINFDYYSTVQINRNYQEYFENPHEIEIEKVKKQIYDIAFGEKVDTALHFLSRALSGHCEDKNFSVYIGNRDCGKGVIYDSLKHAFENYVKPFELSMIQYQRETNQDETSRKLYWLLDLEFARLAVSQEIPAVEKGMKTCGKILKKLTGGGDEHIARRNYDRVDTHFKIDSTFFILGNNEMLVDKQDAFEHCVEFNSVIQFKSKDEIDLMIKNEEDEKIIQIYKVADPNIKNQCMTEEWKNAMIYLLFKNYQDRPVSTFKKKDDYDDNEKSLRKQILEAFTITGSKDDYVTCEDVNNILSSESKGKIKIELESLNVIKKKQNKNEDRNKHCYFGMIKKEIKKEEIDVIENY